MLIIFDIDGTLTLSTEIDREVFASAFAAVFGDDLPSTDWSNYAAATDQGISEEAVRKLGRDPALIPTFKQRFVEELNRRLSVCPVAPVPGARTVLQRLRQAGHQVALATGSWAASARLKLDSAGVDTMGCVLIGSDELPRRSDIIRAAWFTTDANEKPIYVGDGPWDVSAIKALGLRFVGVDAVGTGRLAEHGVQPIAGYEDFDSFLTHLTQAEEL